MKILIWIERVKLKLFLELLSEQQLIKLKPTEVKISYIMDMLAATCKFLIVLLEK